MKKLVSMFLALSMCVSLFVVPASATALDTTGWSYNRVGAPTSGNFPAGYEDGSSWSLISTKINSSSVTLSHWSDFFVWAFGLVNISVDDFTPSKYDSWNVLIAAFGVGYCSKAWLINTYIPYLTDKMLYKNWNNVVIPDEYVYQVFGLQKPVYSVQQDTNGFWRVYDQANSFWVVDSNGQYPFAYDLQDTSAPMSGIKWVKYSSIKALNDAGTLTIVPTTNNALSSLAAEYSYSSASKISKLDSDYNIVISSDSHDSYVLCNLDGYPFAAPVNPSQQQASGEASPRVTTELHEGDQVTNNTDNSVTYGDINLSTGSVYLPEEMNQTIGAITYSNDGDVYNIQTCEQKFVVQNGLLVSADVDMSTEYNITFNVNKTYITYIGTTPDDNIYYEAYYKLPDGRSSADLTKEDLEQLNLNMDVVSYVRSADDVRLRALYHFDGTVYDSSYWNYVGSMTYTSGASYTFLKDSENETTWGGYLYLDTLAHDFSFSLPSNSFGSDFTVDFRYYQSYTGSAASDTTWYIGGRSVLTSDGQNFIFNGSSIPIPTGSWNHLAFVRKSGVLKFYLNGVSVGGTLAFGSSLTDSIRFDLGASQQTYKYLDELHVLSMAYWENTFVPPSAPYTTNLSLILPDGVSPIADEFFTFSNTQTNLLDNDLTLNGIPQTSSIVRAITASHAAGRVFYPAYPSSYVNYQGRNHSVPYYPNWGYTPSLTTLSTSEDGFLLFTADSVTIDGGDLSRTTAFFSQNSSTLGNNKFSLPSGGLYTCLAITSTSLQNLSAGSYTFSWVDSSGEVYSYPFSVPSYDQINNYTDYSYSQGGLTVNVYAEKLNNDSSSKGVLYMQLLPDVGTTVEMLYCELVSGSSTSLEVTTVAGVALVDASSYTKPTLAIRSDLVSGYTVFEGTYYQIGGVRPSVPFRGLIYAMVESGYITSIQQYDGSGWVSVDGRIWTGSRWVPYQYFNVITLSDMYDIADASGQIGYEYIYTESGFWAWFQSQWLDFRNWYHSLSVGSSSPVNVTDLENRYDVDLDVDSGVSGLVRLLAFIQQMFSDAATNASGFFSIYTGSDPDLNTIFVTGGTS